MITVTEPTKCCGCGACAASCPKDCISLQPDWAGSEYPVVDASRCIECGRCERACPVLNPRPEKPRPQRAYLAQHLDKGVLEESTSGGAFTALAQAVIDEGGVVFGAGFDPARQGESGYPLVSHFGVETSEGLALFRNSKYVQSSVGLCYRDVRRELQAGRRVLFSGTPCQVEGLRGFLGKEYPNLCVADVVCRAAPRRPVFNAYVDWLDERRGKRAVAVRFRDKRRFGYRYSNICAFEQGSDRPFYTAGVESDPYLRAFFGNLADREICYECPFKKRYRESDVTMWDCFDVYRLDKSFDDNRGVTRLLVQSERGQGLLEAAAPSLRMAEIDPEAAVEGANEMFHSVPKPADWEDFARDVGRMDGHDLMEKWFPDTPRVKLERWARLACERLGIYDPMKRLVKKVLGKR